MHACCPVPILKHGSPCKKRAHLLVAAKTPGFLYVSCFQGTFGWAGRARWTFLASRYCKCAEAVPRHLQVSGSFNVAAFRLPCQASRQEGQLSSLLAIFLRHDHSKASRRHCLAHRLALQQALPSFPSVDASGTFSRGLKPSGHSGQIGQRGHLRTESATFLCLLSKSSAHTSCMSLLSSLFLAR